MKKGPADADTNAAHFISPVVILGTTVTTKTITAEQFLKLTSCLYVLFALLITGGSVASAQDLEPRRWSHLPTGVNFIAIGVGYAEGDIFLDPVLEIEDAEFESTFAALAYVRSFGLFGKSARFDVRVPYATGRWEGLLQGEPASTRRHGFSDPRFRLSILLHGGPAETREQFAKSRKADTVVGAALAVTVPIGEYMEERLINLGANRWVIRPQLGVTHTRGRWTYELTGSVFFYTDNDEFFGGNQLESDPLYAMQGHLIHTFRAGLWASLGAAYGTGADPTVNGVRRDAETDNWLVALSVGLPIARTQGVKLIWLRTRTQDETGADTDGLLVTYSLMF